MVHKVWRRIILPPGSRIQLQHQSSSRFQITKRQCQRCPQFHPWGTQLSQSAGASLLTRRAPQFQKVFVLNLAERPDKLDAFALASTLTGFTAEIIQGVRGEEVVNKALPSLEGLPEVYTYFSELGCHC